MTEETRPEGQPSEIAPTESMESATAVASPPEEEIKQGPEKLHQTVELSDIGPCKKHVKITVDRAAIDKRISEHYSKLMKDSNVTGFRPGKAPRRLIEKRFHKEVGDQVKNEVLMASLEQLGDDHDIAPLSQPEIDPEEIEIPKEGPMVYEFDVEVRPEFDLPPYRGMKLKRPVRTFTDADIAEAHRHLLMDRGQIVPKENGKVELGDLITADVTFRQGTTVLNMHKEATFNVEKQLAFKDGLMRDFAAKLKGAKAGDTRVVDVELSSAAAEGLANTTIQATLEIKDVKTLRLPELTTAFLEEAFGLSSASGTGRRRSAPRWSVIWSTSSGSRPGRRSSTRSPRPPPGNCPAICCLRQANQAMARRVMEMKADGISEKEINQQRRSLEQDILQNTALELKEHFVLQKIADIEKIDVNEDDINDEIERMAVQNDESPRRIRARLEKENMLDALAAEMIERKALDLILISAEYEDVPQDQDDASAALATVRNPGGARTDARHRHRSRTGRRCRRC